MDNVIILTKNIMAESKLVNQLQIYGYEVFSTQSVLNSILYDEECEFINIFQTMLVSPSISNNEFSIVLENFNYKGHIYRIEDFGNDTDVSQWVKEDDEYVITRSFPYKNIREEFSRQKYDDKKLSEQLVISNTGDSERARLEKVLENFSSKEKQVFNILFSLKGENIDRKELAEKIWNSSSPSDMSQLSQIINRIRLKFSEMNLDSGDIVTNWRKGYALSDKFFIKVLSD